jgi:hypothetical protein
MRRYTRTATLLTAALLAAPAYPQSLEEVVVTGERVSGEDYSRIPAVVLQRRADFLVQRIRLTNDTRGESGRKQELYQTIHDMAAETARHKGLALSYGDEFLIPITATDYAVSLQGHGNRPDTSSAEIYVKMALGEKDEVTRSVAALNAFIKGAHLAGRTEIEQQGDVGLSLVTPEKYRYDIIARIAEDAKKLQATVAGQCKVELTGLSNRVSWRRSDISQLTLYVPFEVQLVGCQ